MRLLRSVSSTRVEPLVSVLILAPGPCIPSRSLLALSMCSVPLIRRVRLIPCPLRIVRRPGPMGMCWVWMGLWEMLWPILLCLRTLLVRRSLLDVLLLPLRAVVSVCVVRLRLLVVDLSVLPWLARCNDILTLKILSLDCVLLPRVWAILGPLRCVVVCLRGPWLRVRMSLRCMLMVRAVMRRIVRMTPVPCRTR